MMKRKLFFWLDRLQISRGERIAISILMTIMLILTTAYTFIDFAPKVDEDAYIELEKVFHERSRIKQQEHDAIMARYEPVNVIENQYLSNEKSLSNGTDTNMDEGRAESKESELDGLPGLSEIPEPDTSLGDSVKVNINKASAEELQKLPGIGPAYSKRIIEWRKEHGEFTTVEQLLEIRGIGPVRLEKIRPLIVL
jgi:competence ComEA-like helix-hairpin-helix protein